MPGLLGQYDFQIDAKGRVSFPSAFRRAVSSDSLVLLQWQPSHLDLFPEETWAAIQQNLLDHRKARGDGGAYLRRITSSAVEIELDAQGRLRIPPWLREKGGLDRSVLFIGAVDRMELWNPETFAREIAKPRADDEDLSGIFS